MFAGAAHGSVRVCAVALLALLLRCHLGRARAEEPSVAVVTGRVLGASGEPVAGVEVRLRDAAHAVDPQALSGPDGIVPHRSACPRPAPTSLVCVLGTRWKRARALPWRGRGSRGRGPAADPEPSEPVSVTADAWIAAAWTCRTARPSRTIGAAPPAEPRQPGGRAAATCPTRPSASATSATATRSSAGAASARCSARAALVLPGRLSALQLPRPLRRAALEHGHAGGDRSASTCSTARSPRIHPATRSGPRSSMTERTPRRRSSGRAASPAYSQSFGQYGESDDYTAASLGLRRDALRRRALWVGDHLQPPGLDVAADAVLHRVGRHAAGACSRRSPDRHARVRASSTTGTRTDLRPRDLRRQRGRHRPHAPGQREAARWATRSRPSLEASAIVAGWQQRHREQQRHVPARLRRAPAVWQGRRHRRRPAASTSPRRPSRRSTRDEIAPPARRARVRTHRPAGWNGSVVVSDYRILDDAARQANNPDPVAAAGGARHRHPARRHWLEHLRGAGRPTATTRSDLAGGRHALTFGAHRNALPASTTS